MSGTGKILAIGGLFIASIIGAAIATNSQRNQIASGQSCESKVKTLRFSMSSNNKHPIYDGASKFKEIVEKYTDLTVDIYPSAQLGMTALRLKCCNWAHWMCLFRRRDHWPISILNTTFLTCHL